MNLLVIATTLVWLGLLLAHGGYWLMRERDTAAPSPEPRAWPSVTAVVPARDEAEVIARSLGSLAAQDYPGRFRIILVDDNSSDGTAEIAQEAFDGVRTLLPSPAQAGAQFPGQHWAPAFAGEGGDAEWVPDPVADRLTILRGKPLPSGWTGKLWAVSQGVAAAGMPNYLWLTDADIAHAPDTLRSLVARAVGEDRVLVSLMAKLRCESLAERALIPAFVYFFAMVYPFARVNGRGRTAGAAGGCMLARRDALERAGGIAAIRGALIDDCAFGAMMKREGSIWLGLTERSISLRVYPRFGDVAAMIARSAYAQLGYSPFALAGTIVALALVFVAPPLLAVAGGAGGWFPYALVTLSLLPITLSYRRSPLWALLLPAIAAFYAGCTLLSAWQHSQGRGGMWKGRAQAAAGR